MKKNLYLFLLIVIIALSSCKKSCDFPKYLDGKYCTDIRESLIGDYYGTSYSDYMGPYYGTFAQYQVVLVSEGTGNFTNLIVDHLNCTLDEHGNLSIPNQFQQEDLYKPYHASGTGFIGDTTMDGVQNKYVTLNVFFTSDSSYDANFSYTYFGLR